jgi:hypothetical protein
MKGGAMNDETKYQAENGRFAVAAACDRRRGGRTALLLAVLGVIGGLSGCASVRVQPWERGTLADYSMRSDRDPLATAASEHTYFSRESATGGRGVGGSGCGCN